MKILVTGGAGFIGSNLVNLLLSKGHDVTVVDDLSTGKYNNIINVLRSIKFYLLDIRSKDVDKVFEIEKPDVVVHLAAQASVIASVEDPLLDLDVNLRGIVNLLNNCIKHKVNKFVFISTGGAIYGDANQIPTNETYIPDVISPYALTKHTSENYLKVFKKMYGLEYSVLRLANVYGPRQVPKGECGVIPIYFEKCLSNEDAVLFAYSNMPKGTARDYVYVDDVCEAIERCLINGNGEIFNIGTGVETYTKDVFDKIKALTSSSSEIILKDARPGDVRRGILDCRKAKDVLKWEPKIDFNVGLNHTCDWINTNPS
jgi:UDP-glucose 4-epimerase